MAANEKGRARPMEIMLLTATKDVAHSQAAVLADWLEEGR